MRRLVSDFTEMRFAIPAGESGNAKIEHYQIGEEEAAFTKMRMIATGDIGEMIAEGWYTRLIVDGMIMMSDTPMEQRSNIGFLLNVERAGGDVLVAGLGIGMILLPALRYDSVDRVDVVESNPDVIRLVEEPLRKAVGPRDERKLNVIEADIFDWKPPRGKKWDVIYFDIWPTRCTDNLREISRLKRKFARRLKRENPDAWMGAWLEGELRYRQRRERRDESWWGIMRRFGDG